MHRLLPILCLFGCLISYGQNSMLNNVVSWFSKADRTAIDVYLKNCSYRFISEQDSLELKLLTYSVVKTDNGTQPFITLLLSDTTLEFISVNTYGGQGQQLIVSGLKSGRFKSIGTDINGNFITTTYDNGTFLIHEDYEAVANPLGKGEIAYFRYRIFRKYGKFDTMNGEKIKLSEKGDKILASYKNGVLDGQRTFFFPDGTIKRTENYRAGRLNGVASDYNQQGKLIHSSTHSYHWKYGMEKWFSYEGKLVKSLQWQRDVPTGLEKQTFNGKTVGSVSYVKGKKQGPAMIPVYYDQFIEANTSPDTLNEPPLAIETVNYTGGLKSGKAVCIYFNTSDTMYVGYYKAGLLDSIFSKYSQEGILYTSFFSDGLENGPRVYKIPNGPLKDSIYRVENYKTGKLHGLVNEYYQKEAGIWKKIYREENYTEGIQNGRFVYEDPENKGVEFYVDGKLHGRQEYHVVADGKKNHITKNYVNGLKSGEWVSENVTDNILVIENYQNNLKEGDQFKTVKNKLTEKLIYRRGVLVDLQLTAENGAFHSFDMTESETGDSVTVGHSNKSGDTTTLICYSFSRTDFPYRDTSLLLMANKILAAPAENIASNGLFQTTTPQFHTVIILKNGKMDGQQSILHRKAEILEKLDYQNGMLLTAKYRIHQNQTDGGPYSGTFFSDYSHEKITVKDGLRHGWCAEYTASGKELRRTKYKNGVSVKTIESQDN